MTSKILLWKVSIPYRWKIFRLEVYRLKVYRLKVFPQSRSKFPFKDDLSFKFKPTLYQMALKFQVCSKNLKVSFKYKSELSSIDERHLKFSLCVPKLACMLQNFRTSCSLKTVMTTSWKPVLRTDFLWTSSRLNRIEHHFEAIYPNIFFTHFWYIGSFQTLYLWYVL